MMREIKFRAWSPLAREMYKVNSLHFDKEGLSEIVVEVFEVDGVIYSSAVARNLELMQFTGLKDKKGKDIYEGDIVYDSEGIVATDDKKYFPVTWGIFPGDLDECETWILGDFWEPGLYTHHEDVEVVGNIYENPELLEVNKPVEPM
jgi:uncharacterized phage protein (TIGR01671 family)